ncbi:MAG TPA: FixH family protein [Nitrospirota bacterium]|nr:FixH family protein [Nitrospirota bacterium]
MRRLSTFIAAVVLSHLLFHPGVSLAGMVGTTDARLFQLELEMEPAQPVVGTNAAVLTVIDARTNRPVDDAVLEVVPWMTMHGHGSPKKPAVRKTDVGRYRVENIFYTMEGAWDLLVTVQKGDSKDTATFPVTQVKKK